MVLCSLTVLAQKDSTFLYKAVNAAQSQPVNEKVYLHFDRPTYFRGDTIWYKAYVVIGQKHQLSALSKVLHVELIGPNDSVYKRENLALISGVAWGDFSLSKKLKSGNYYIRAYTNYMRNESLDLFFEQKLNILGVTTISDVEDASNDIKIQFYPEGGELVNGLSSKVVVKASYQNNMNDTLKGTILDNKGIEIVHFKTNQQGLTSFNLTPEEGKNYKARILFSKADSILINLPSAKQKGLNLSVNNSSPDSIWIKVALNTKLFNEKKHSKFYLITQQGGKPLFATTGQLETPIFITSISKAKIPSGIVQFTLFDENGKPLNNRIAYIKNSDTIKFSLTPNTNRFKIRQKVKFDITSTNSNNLPVQGAFSVSVINESRTGFDEKDEDHIVSTFLLSADLKGIVKQPGYYFSNSDNLTMGNLDLMLLTHDYKRFNWKKVLDSIAMPLNFKPETGLELSGNIQTPGGKPVPNSKVTFTASKENFITDTITDLNGNFNFKNLNLSDTNKIVLNAHKHNKSNNVTIFVKKPDYPLVLKHNKNNDSINSSSPKKNIEKNDQFNANSITFTIKGNMLSKYPDLTAALKATLPEISFNNGRFMNNKAPAKDMALIIDGKQKTTADLNVYKIDEIDRVNILDSATNQNKYAIRGNYDNKLIAITTKKYAGSDTATTLRQVNIIAKKVHKPDMYNGYGSHYEYLADMKRVNQSLTLEDAFRSAIPGLGLRNDKYYYERPDHIVKLIINNFPVEVEDLKLYSPSEVDNIRLIEGIDKYNPPTLIITTKRFVGSDTSTIIKLKEVNVKAQKINKAPVITHSANLNGAGNADQIIMGNDLSNCVNLYDCLIGKIHNVSFKNGVVYSTRTQERLEVQQKSSYLGIKDPDENHLNDLNQIKLEGTKPPMAVIIDGVLLDGTHLGDVNGEDIYSIEVLRSGAYLAIYGSNAAGGALVITTKRGSESGFQPNASTTGIINFQFSGYYKPKVFPELKFSTSLNNSNATELKNTIYWQPNIITDKDGKASIEFYNNDTKGTYRIVIEGIDDNGNLGRFVYKYIVE